MLDEKIGVEREELKGKFIIVKSKSALTPTIQSPFKLKSLSFVNSNVVL